VDSGVSPNSTITEQLPDRFFVPTAEQVPERDIDPGKRVIGLQQIQTVGSHQIADPANVGGAVDRLTKYRSLHGLAGTVRHRADQAGDRHQRRRFALTPANMVTGGDANQKCVLTAVANIQDFGHCQVEKVD
jgi:hypothetical protein